MVNFWLLTLKGTKTFFSHNKVSNWTEIFVGHEAGKVNDRFMICSNPIYTIVWDLYDLTETTEEMKEK